VVSEAASFPILPSAARIASVNSNPFGSGGAAGLFVVIDVTAIVATPSIVFKLQGLDRVSAKWFDILTSAAITGVGTTVLRVHPELTAVANTVAKDMLPETLRVVATAADADSCTYSVGAILAP
jgi:hypothetical protein